MIEAVWYLREKAKIFLDVATCSTSTLLFKIGKNTIFLKKDAGNPIGM
jgi:hypothetical protein